MFFGMHVDKDEAETYGIGPTDLGDLDGERLIGGREFDMKGEAGTSGQGFFAHHMTTFFGETRDQSASGNVAAGKRERYLNFITRVVATLHRCPLLSRPIWLDTQSFKDGYAVLHPKSTGFPLVHDRDATSR